MSSDEPDTSCYRWCRDFVVAHAIFASGLVTFPAAVLLLVNRPHSGRATFFAAFAALCTATSLILCLRFYAELRRPPWLSAAASGGDLLQQEDAEAPSAVAGEETTTTRAMSSRALHHPEQLVIIHRAEMHDYQGDGAAEDCAVCLGEMEKGETMRQLPVCQHVFHRECIDPWLRAHATCPVCRSSVLPAAGARAEPDRLQSASSTVLCSHQSTPSIFHPTPGPSQPNATSPSSFAAGCTRCGA